MEVSADEERGAGGRRLTVEEADELRSTVTDLMRGNFFDLLLVRLRHRYPRHSGLAEEAVADAVEQLVLRHDRVREVEPWLWTVSLHQLGKLVVKAERHTDLDDRDDAPAPDAAEQALVRETFRVVRDAVLRWDNKRVRVVTLLYLEAAVELVRLDRAEAARLAGQILGETINPESVSQWRKRGFRDLRRMLDDLSADGRPDERKIGP